MAEKRRLPPRDRRESAAKRRVSEAAPQSTKKKAPTPRASSPLEPVDAPLPTSLKDVEGLPVLRARQPLTLSDKEYQSIAESAVLLTALERSKKKWLSDGILVRYFTKPKKTKREQIERNNPPKDSMTKVGPCDITIGPHFFDAMIYTVKDPNAPPSLQYASPQRPMVHYGHPNNFQQYRPYPSPSIPQRPNQYSPAGRPGYSGSHPPAQQPRGPNQGNAPSPQGGQRPQQGQKGPNGQPAKPSPDPVIQMLATRAAADPELKALMRVVASSQASQEQLRAFQAHIDELNAIIKSREQQEQRQPASAAPTQPQQSPQAQSTPQPQPQPKQDGEAKPTSKEQPETQTKTPAKQPPAQAETQPHPPAASAEKPVNPQSSTGPAMIKQESTTLTNKDSQAAPTPSTAGGNASTPAPASTPGQQQSLAVNPTPPPASRPQSAARPGPPYPQPAYGSQTPIQSRPPQYSTPNSFYRSPVAPLPPPRVGYKAVVFEFTSPLTPYGNATSGHAGSGDRYLFPEHTILEWLPDENTVIASFLVVRKVDPNTPFPLETPTEAANSRSKGKSAPKTKKGEPKGKAVKGTDSAGPQTPNQSAGTPQKQEPTDSAMPEASGTPVNEANLKEYWQPVTFRIHSPSTTILEPLARVVKPADEVRKYMNEIMDRAERAPDGFLAMRLPREESHEPFESEGTPASNIGTRSRLSHVQLADEESEVETSAFEFEEEDEDELKDFYDAPYGLPPLKT